VSAAEFERFSLARVRAPGLATRLCEVRSCLFGEIGALVAADNAVKTLSMSPAPLVVLFLALSLILLLLTIFSRAFGLGENEGYVFYRLLGLNRAQVAVAAATFVVASCVALVSVRVKGPRHRASVVIVLFIVVASILLVSAIFAGPIGLGLKAEFVFYRVWGIDRSDLAVGAVAAIILSVIALAVVRRIN
jgi:hypothetical protein